jgi:hypothetical protein
MSFIPFRVAFQMSPSIICKFVGLQFRCFSFGYRITFRTTEPLQENWWRGRERGCKGMNGGNVSAPSKTVASHRPAVLNLLDFGRRAFSSNSITLAKYLNGSTGRRENSTRYRR